MNTSAAEATQPDNTAGKAAWICLAITWATFLIPVPGIGLLIGWPLNLLAFILAVVAMSRLGARAGVLPMLASLIMSPFVYFIGILILAGTLNTAPTV